MDNGFYFATALNDRSIYIKTKMEQNRTLTLEEQEFATAKTGYLFRKFAIPGVIGLLFVGIQTMIDGTILGNFVNANALAGINIILPLYTLMTALAIVTGIGCQTLVSMALGAGNHKRANDALTTAFFSLIIISLVMSSVFLCFTNTITELLGANETLAPYSASYLKTLSPFFPVLTVMFMGDYILKAIGRPYFAMTVLGGTVIINVILDFIFIVGLNMGTAGAGLATGLSFACGCAIILPVLMDKNSLASVRKGDFRISLLGRMMYNGSSEGLSELSAGITIYLFNLVMVHYYGEAGVAAYTSITYILYIGIIISVGMSDGIIPIISFNYGAGNWDRVIKVFKTAAGVSLITGIILFSIMFFGGGKIIRFFFREDATETIAIASTGAVFCAFAFLLNGINILFSSFFTSLGDAKRSVIISLMRGLVLICTGIILYPLLFGMAGIWITIPAAEFITFIIGITLVRRRLTAKT